MNFANKLHESFLVHALHAGLETHPDWRLQLDKLVLDASITAIRW